MGSIRNPEPSKLGRSAHPADDRRVHLIFALDHVAALVFYSQGENRQVALFSEILVRNGSRQNAVQPFPVRGFVAMPPQVPGKNAGLVGIAY